MINTLIYERYGTALCSAAVVTGLLLLLMQQLIATGPIDLEEPRVFRLTPWVRVVTTTPLNTKVRTVIPPPVVAQKPTTTVPETGGGRHKVRVPMTVKAPTKFGPSRVGRRSMFTEGEYLPLVKPPPGYPDRAITRGIEGYVIVEFTVTPLGTVENVRIAQSSNSIFDRAATKAAKRFRYKPRVIDGTAVAVHNVRNKITFRLKE